MANEKLFSAKSQQPELLTLGVKIEMFDPKAEYRLRSYLLSKC